MSDNDNSITTSPQRSVITLGAKGIQLTNFEELFRFSQFVQKAGFAPRGMETPEKVFLAVQMGLELGISPMMSLQNAAVINGRPGFFGELVVALIQAHPEYVDMITDYAGEGDSYGCTVTIKRRGRTPSSGTFTVAQAKTADLIGNPSKKDTWGKFRDDMLFWRAFSRAKRIFSDVLRGFKTVEELGDLPDEKPAEGRVVEPNFGTATPDPIQLPTRPRGRPPKAPTQPESPEPMPAAAAEIPPEPEKKEEHLPEVSALDEVIMRLAEEKIQQKDYLEFLNGLDWIKCKPGDIDLGHFTISKVPEEALKHSLADWARVVNTIKGEETLL